jgi:hypothetical protein
LAEEMETERKDNWQKRWRQRGKIIGRRDETERKDNWQKR